ncbi:hypothetical protein DL95DRAFT_478510, partial [Leptodontidium sp. 2 PMI_412]
GWSGLVAAKTYLQIRPDAELLILDNDTTIGGTWSEERLYPHLVAEAHHGLFEFSDLEMSDEGINEQGQIPGRAVYNYLAAYAAKFKLVERMRLGRKVTRVVRGEKGRWTTEVTDGGEGKEVFESEKLIVATGLTSEAFMPQIPNEGFHGEVLHAKELGKASTMQKIRSHSIKTVAVYGGSKSAFDAVYILLQAGKSVKWIIRNGGGGASIMSPLRILGSPSFRVNNSRLMGMFSPNLFDQTEGGAWQWMMHGPGSRYLGEPLVKLFWRVISYFLQRDAQYDRSDNGKRLKPEMGLDSLFWSPATLGVMTQPDLWEDIHRSEKVQVYRGSIDALSPIGLKLHDGREEAVDMAIFATGWHATHSMFSTEHLLRSGLPAPKGLMAVTGRDGTTTGTADWKTLSRSADEEVLRRLPLLAQSPPGHATKAPEQDYHLYRHIAPSSLPDDDRSLAYIGFLRTTVAPIVYEAQALWAAAYLAGKLDVPCQAEREADVALQNAWVRRRHVCGRKIPFALFDFLPYVSMLYRDLGVNSKRKGGWIVETFGLYKPRDFRGVVEEWLEKEGEGLPLRGGRRREPDIITPWASFTARVLLVVALATATLMMVFAIDGKHSGVQRQSQYR